jgi:hypothetical protein
VYLEAIQHGQAKTPAAPAPNPEAPLAMPVAITAPLVNVPNRLVPKAGWRPSRRTLLTCLSVAAVVTLLVGVSILAGLVSRGTQAAPPRMEKTTR